MRRSLNCRQRLAVLGPAVLATTHALAGTYTDTIGDNAGTNPDIDIASVVISNTATDITFQINLNPAVDIIAPDGSQIYGKYQMGFQMPGGGGSTAVTNPWGNPIGISGGMNYWFGSWCDNSSVPPFSGYAQVYHWNGASWDVVAGLNSVPFVDTPTTLDHTSITISMPLSVLGNPSSFNFDVWSTFGIPGGQSAYDSVTNPATTVADPWNGTPYDSGALLSTYTVVVPSTWQTNGDGNWSNAANWQNGVPNAIDAVANFAGAISTSHTITVDGSFTVGTMNFDNVSASYTVAGPGTLTVNTSGAQAGINVNSGNHSITAAMNLSKNTTFNVASGSSLSMGSLLNASSVAVTKTGAGSATFANVRATGLTISAGTVAIATNGSNAGTSRVGALSIAGGPSAPTAALDLRDNDLISQASTYSDVSTMIAYARHGGAWDRTGITSSSAATAPSHDKTLGALTGAEFHAVQGISATFDGFSVANTDLLVKFTYYGDTDFNGKVDGADYARVDTTFNNETSQGNIPGWVNGDFDYNGKVDGADYALIDSAFNSQLGTLRPMLGFLDGTNRDRSDMTSQGLQQVLKHFDEFGDSYVLAALSNVPEPGSACAAMLLIGLTFAPRQRRRRA